MRWLGIFAILFLGGCTKQSPPLPTPVAAKGRVHLLSGQPLQAGRIVLIPKPNQKNGQIAIEAFGDVTDGKFTLTTYSLDDGAVPGEYVAVVSPYNYCSKTGSPVRLTNTRQIPKKYQDEITSDWLVRITETNNILDLYIK